MLTNKGKYGLKAMVHLAGLEPGALAQVQDIADRNAIPKKFLDQILSEFRNAGLVFSKKGKGGGYALAARPQIGSARSYARSTVLWRRSNAPASPPIAPATIAVGTKGLRGQPDHGQGPQRHRRRARQS